MSKKKTPYAVGYGKPPTHTRFQKGRSGNPKGRPRKGDTAGAPLTETGRAILACVGAPVRVREGGQVIDMESREAVIAKLREGALKGDSRAQAQFIALMQAAEADHYGAQCDAFFTAVRFVSGWRPVVAARRAQGLSDFPGAPPWPHPDDVVLDFETGAVGGRGPISEAEGRQFGVAACLYFGGLAEAAAVEAEMHAPANPDEPDDPDAACRETWLAWACEERASLDVGSLRVVHGS